MGNNIKPASAGENKEIKGKSRKAIAFSGTFFSMDPRVRGKLSKVTFPPENLKAMPVEIEMGTAGRDNMEIPLEFNTLEQEQALNAMRDQKRQDQPRRTTGVRGKQQRPKTQGSNIKRSDGRVSGEDKIR